MGCSGSKDTARGGRAVTKPSRSVLQPANASPAPTLEWHPPASVLAGRRRPSGSPPRPSQRPTKQPRANPPRTGAVSPVDSLPKRAPSPRLSKQPASVRRTAAGSAEPPDPSWVGAALRPKQPARLPSASPALTAASRRKVPPSSPPPPHESPGRFYSPSTLGGSPKAPRVGSKSPVPAVQASPRRGRRLVKSPSPSAGPGIASLPPPASDAWGPVETIEMLQRLSPKSRARGLSLLRRSASPPSDVPAPQPPRCERGQQTDEVAPPTMVSAAVSPCSPSLSEAPPSPPPPPARPQLPRSPSARLPSMSSFEPPVCAPSLSQRRCSVSTYPPPPSPPPAPPVLPPLLPPPAQLPLLPRPAQPPLLPPPQTQQAVCRLCGEPGGGVFDRRQPAVCVPVPRWEPAGRWEGQPKAEPSPAARWEPSPAAGRWEPAIRESPAPAAGRWEPPAPQLEPARRWEAQPAAPVRWEPPALVCTPAPAAVRSARVSPVRVPPAVADASRLAQLSHLSRGGTPSRAMARQAAAQP
eukprot:TRINITY_DN10569_c0_g1_i1.p1 TRINITY_DN10569_c0_g1~~TRINITY_DN10569_c0_g1_i1.p1  ORF type:complete len:525 (+),score=117.92 TRINITY_DN10569_c0_g1_i1:73-1647(+)